MTPNILITGANRGIGLEFVRQYLPSGARIWACCRDPEKATELSSLARQYADQLTIRRLDVADFQAIENLADELRDIPLDLLINNAGVYGSRDNQFGTINYDDWAQTFHINTLAPLKIAESFVDHLARAGKASGRSVLCTISSKMGSIDDNTSGGSYVYRTSKAAANMVNKSLSVDLAPKQIICIALHPGWVKTDMGGPNALITVEQSVTGMRQVIDNLTADQNGAFLAYDGQDIAW